MIGEPDVPPDSATHADEDHYAGDDTDVGTLMTGFLAAFKGISIEAFEAKSDAFLRGTPHPTLGRGYLECVYEPMIELLAYLEANAFSNYIASGGGRDFRRPVTRELYGIPRDRVIGTASTFEYTSTEMAAPSRTRPKQTSSTTAHRIRSGSGAAPAAARSSPQAIPTATSRCSSSPTT